MSYTNGLDKPSDYFNTVTYTGNGTARDITTGLTTTDWVWIKRRDGTANHRLTDVVRGATNMLSSNNTNATQTHAQTVTAFGTNTFSLGTDSGSYDVNTNSQTYASWNWSAGGSASSNTDGSITSTVSANTTAGFSIVTWTAPSSGANTDTIGHGLSAVPKMIIARSRSNADGWRVYHHVPGIDKHGSLNNTNGFNSNTNIFPTLPTTSVFYPGSDASINSSSRTYVGYCFAEKKGYSKFGSYVGNGSSDGSYIHMGMKPAWFLTKKSSASGTGWFVFDNQRDPLNPNSKFLMTQASNSEDDNTNRGMDFLSNGIKIRGTNGDVNESGSTYIYMAFAENPFVTGTSGIPCTAR